MPVPRAEILRLYKECLVYVNGLKYSDRGFLRNRLRQEFRQVADEDYVEYFYNKGKAFLERGRII